MSDAAAIDQALLERLAGDSALAALLPGGVFFDIGAKGQTAFTLLSVSEDATALPLFSGLWGLRTVYLAKAVLLDKGGSAAQQAAARIHELLEWTVGDPAPLTIEGFDLVHLQRLERVRYTETDPANPDLRWQHQGGLYEVMTAPIVPATVR